MRVQFRVNGFSLAGEWDDEKRMVLVTETQGGLEVSGTILGHTIRTGGLLEMGPDNSLRARLNTVKGIPRFMLPVVLRFLVGRNRHLAKAAEIRGDMVVLDPNALLPEDGLRVFLQPRENAADISESEVATIRERVVRWAAQHGGDIGRDAAQIVVSIPDLLVLLLRLAKDPRVPAACKWKIALATAYVLSPVDLIPEAVVGPLGLVDDALALVLVVTELFARIPAEVIRDNWTGNEDVLELVVKGQDILSRLIPGGVLQKLLALFRMGSQEAKKNA